jgi:probable rRNA maturation factor
MIDIINNKEGFQSKKIIKNLVPFLLMILKDFNQSNRDVTVVFCENAFIQSLNKEFRHIDKPTDVLSFSQSEGEEMDGDDASLGDIIISIDKAKEQSVEYSVPLYEEISRLAIHGILHLLGFDHEKSREEEKRMFDKQNSYLEQFLREYPE